MPVRAAAAKAAAAVQRQSKRVPIGTGRSSSRRGVQRVEDDEEEDDERQEDGEQTMQEDEENDGNEEEDADENEDERPAPSSSRPQTIIRGNKPRYILVSDHGQTFLAPANRASNYRALPTRKPKMEAVLDTGIETGPEGDEEDSAAQTPAPMEDESGMSTPNFDQQKKKRLIRIPLKRGRGRPPKGRPRLQGWEEVEDETEGANTPEANEEDGSVQPDDTEAANTPAPGEDEGGENDYTGAEVDAEFATRQTVYIDGRQYPCIDDELQIDEDEAGNAKIDSKGKLLGGRSFTFPVFQSPERPDPEKWYALSIDAARAAGHRDSFFFYRKNQLLVKLSCTDSEKAWLIANKRLPAHLRTRSVNMVAVRNIYKLHGAQIIQNGKHVTDDYYEKAAREAGKVEGEPANSMRSDDQYNNDAVANEYLTAANLGFPQPIRSSDRQRREQERERDRLRRRPDAFTHATSDLQGNPWFTTFGDSGEAPFDRAKAWPSRRATQQRIELNDVNWMIEMARSVRGMNREILMGHRERLRAFGRPFEATEGYADEEEEEKEKEAAEKEEPEKEGMEGIEGDKSENVEEEEKGDSSVTIKKRKTSSTSSLPIGLYEPLTNLPHYPITTQSKWAMFERLGERPILAKGREDKQAVPQTNGHHQVKSERDGDTSMADISVESEDTSTSKAAKSKATEKNDETTPILGGGKVGSYAWGVASIEQRVQLPLPRKGNDIRITPGASAKEMDM